MVFFHSFGIMFLENHKKTKIIWRNYEKTINCQKNFKKTNFCQNNTKFQLVLFVISFVLFIICSRNEVSMKNSATPCWFFSCMFNSSPPWKFLTKIPLLATIYHLSSEVGIVCKFLTKNSKIERCPLSKYFTFLIQSSGKSIL